VTNVTNVTVLLLAHLTEGSAIHRLDEGSVSNKRNDLAASSS
jgi:hypothetical protein